MDNLELRPHYYKTLHQAMRDKIYVQYENYDMFNMKIIRLETQTNAKTKLFLPRKIAR